MLLWDISPDTIHFLSLGGFMTPGDVLSIAANWLDGLSPLTTALLFAGMWFFGFVVAKAGEAKKTLELTSLRKDCEQGEKRIASYREGKKIMGSTLEALESRNKENSILISMLPDVVDKLSSTDKLEPLLRDIVVTTERLLQAKQVSVFLRKEGELILMAASGSAPLPSPPLSIPVGEGTMGWVAEKGITMTDQDLIHESNLVKSNLSEQQAELTTKICSPLIQSGELLGVVNIGSIAVSDDIGIRMAKMIASLASIALGNLLLKQEIKVVADRDGLTGLHSLQHFLAELTKELGKARRYKRPFALCHFNIDNFARYNEINGYLAGDEVLRMMSKILTDHLREQDMVARFSGKEFVILCPETQQKDAIRLAEKLGSIIHRAPFPRKETMPGGSLSVSCGVSAYPEGGATENELIGSVVAATQKARRAGGRAVIGHEQAETGLPASS